MSRGRRTGLVALSVAIAGAAAWHNFGNFEPGRSYEGPLPALTDPERDMAQRLQSHVTAIASKPHNVDFPEALEQSALYIESTLAAMGYKPETQGF